jgi:hypothetical protein
MAQHLTLTHATVPELTRKVEEHDHSLFMASFISSSGLFSDMAKKERIVVELSD